MGSELLVIALAFVVICRHGFWEVYIYLVIIDLLIIIEAFLNRVFLILIWCMTGICILSWDFLIFRQLGILGVFVNACLVSTLRTRRKSISRITILVFPGSTILVIPSSRTEWLSILGTIRRPRTWRVSWWCRNLKSCWRSWQRDLSVSLVALISLYYRLLRARILLLVILVSIILRLKLTLELKRLRLPRLVIPTMGILLSLLRLLRIWNCLFRMACCMFPPLVFPFINWLKEPVVVCARVWFWNVTLKLYI